jgi:endoglucanase
MAVELGAGPAIKVRDTHMISDPRIVDLMIKRAEDAGIPYQLEVLRHGSTDASTIQLVRAGIPAGCLSIPCRYIHTSSEMVDSHDVENAVHLLDEILRKPIDL